jgi:hypothetical protein
MHIETLNEIIRRIYAAANGGECWDNVVVDVGDQLDLGVIHLFLTNLDNGVSYIGSSPRGDPELDKNYQEEYSEHDFRLPRIMALERGRMFDERSIASDDEIRKSPVHQELFVKNDIHRIVGSNMSVDNALGWFGVTTSRASDDFSWEQRQALDFLAPHVLQAFEIAKTRADLLFMNDANLAVVASVGVGVLYTENDRVTGCNDIADTILRQGFIKLIGGRLRCRDEPSDGKLRAFLGSSTRPANNQLRLTDSDQGLDYLINTKTVSPLSDDVAGGIGQRGVILIRMLDRAGKPDLETVSGFGKNFRLSDAQVSAVHAVLCNVPLSKLADTRGVKPDTIRKQLKLAMEKLDVRSQKELVMLFERTSLF